MMTYYQAYLKLQDELDVMIAAGTDESPAGDTLRDEMDKLWWKLTAEEKRELNKNVKFPRLPNPV